MKIFVLHLDLGIGGAERLIVDLSLCILNLGHKLKIFTSHHDPKHCFEETKSGKL